MLFSSSTVCFGFSFNLTVPPTVSPLSLEVFTQPQHTHTRGHREASLSLRVSAALLSQSVPQVRGSGYPWPCCGANCVCLLCSWVHAPSSHYLLGLITVSAHHLCVKAEEDAAVHCSLSPGFPMGGLLDTATVPVSDFCFNFHLELNV